ncbi:MAG: caspase family protein, partial [Bacteroidota bacterium]
MSKPTISLPQTESSVASQIANPFRNHRSLAVIIGVNKYPDSSIPDLKNARSDAEELARVLAENHGYEVRSYLDEEASLANLEAVMEQLLSEGEGLTDNDRIIFYFAGHGLTISKEGAEDEEPEGYLIPSDADLGKTETYYSMAKLRGELESLECRHGMLILDCCFAGSFLWSSGSRDLFFDFPSVIYQERFDQYVEDKAWQVIASAAGDEKASDADKSGGKAPAFGERPGSDGEFSPFASALFDGLSGKGDMVPEGEGDGLITGIELYTYLREEVRKKTNNKQTPVYSTLKNHHKGQYIFLYPHGGTLPPMPERNPFKGEVPYEKGDQDLFFGRDLSVAYLNNRFKEDATSVSERPANHVKHQLTVLSGQTGSGKTSLIQAGLMPELLPDEWHIMENLGEGPYFMDNIMDVGDHLLVLSYEEPDLQKENAEVKAWYAHQRRELETCVDYFLKEYKNLTILLFYEGPQRYQVERNVAEEDGGYPSNPRWQAPLYLSEEDRENEEEVDVLFTRLKSQLSKHNLTIVDQLGRDELQARLEKEVFALWRNNQEIILIEESLRDRDFFYALTRPYKKNLWIIDPLPGSQEDEEDEGASLMYTALGEKIAGTLEDHPFFSVLLSLRPSQEAALNIPALKHLWKEARFLLPNLDPLSMRTPLVKALENQRLVVLTGAENGGQHLLIEELAKPVARNKSWNIIEQPARADGALEHINEQLRAEGKNLLLLEKYDKWVEDTSSNDIQVWDKKLQGLLNGPEDLTVLLSICNHSLERLKNSLQSRIGTANGEGENWAANVLEVPLLDKAAIEAVVVRPANQMILSLEGSDIEDSRNLRLMLQEGLQGAEQPLPLISKTMHALVSTYEEGVKKNTHQNRMLTKKDYDTLDGYRGELGKMVKVFWEQLEFADQDRMRKLLLRMVKAKGNNLSIQPIKDSSLKYRDKNETLAIAKLCKRLVEARIISISLDDEGEVSYRLSHADLYNSKTWRAYGSWIYRDKDMLRQMTELDEAVQQNPKVGEALAYMKENGIFSWKGLEWRPGGSPLFRKLWNDHGKLDRLLTLQKESTNLFNEQEEDFLEASEKFLTRKETRNQSLRNGFIVLILGFSLGIAGSLYSVWQQKKELQRTYEKVQDISLESKNRLRSMYYRDYQVMLDKARQYIDPDAQRRQFQTALEFLTDNPEVKGLAQDTLIKSENGQEIMVTVS